MSATAQDISRLVARSTQRASSIPKLVGPVTDNESHALELTIGPGQTIWLTDDDVAVADLPPGASKIDAPIADGGLPTITITPGLTTGAATISGGKYKVLDDRGDLDEWLKDKVSNGFQLFGGSLKHYIFPKGTPINSETSQERALSYTWLIKGSISLDRRVYTFNCEDVSRDLDQDIFVERAHTVMATITESEDSPIEVYLTDIERGSVGHR